MPGPKPRITGLGILRKLTNLFRKEENKKEIPYKIKWRKGKRIPRWPNRGGVGKPT